MAVSDALMMIERHCDTLNDLVAQFPAQTTPSGPLMDTGLHFAMPPIVAMHRLNQRAQKAAWWQNTA